MAYKSIVGFISGPDTTELDHTMNSTTSVGRITAGEADARAVKLAKELSVEIGIFEALTVILRAVQGIAMSAPKVAEKEVDSMIETAVSAIPRQRANYREQHTSSLDAMLLAALDKNALPN